LRNRSAKSGVNWARWPHYCEDEIAASSRVLESGRVNYWTGEEGRSFEREFADFVGVRHGVAVANGSLALGIAIRAIGLPAQAEIIVTPRTFIASVSEIILAGATPVFADVDIDSQNISAASIESVMSSRTAAIMTVHLAGWPCDMPGITELASKHGLLVIEDCAQSHGAVVADKKTGSWGDISAFSFCQDKIMSTGGEGGMIVTDNEQLSRKCWSFKDHGKAPDLLSSKDSSDNVFKWLHESIGTNARLTEPQAAIGRAQLRKLPEWLHRRRENAAYLTSRLREVSGLRIAVPGDGIEHAYYKYYCFVCPDALRGTWSRDRILAELARLGIPCGSGVCPDVSREAAITPHLDGTAAEVPNASRLGETSIMLPVHPTLGAEHMARIADAIEAVLASAIR
jgi:dTDP-4-amino-4,6-dideoxygalactose transaminase